MPVRESHKAQTMECRTVREPSVIGGVHPIIGRTDISGKNPTRNGKQIFCGIPFVVWEQAEGRSTFGSRPSRSCLWDDVYSDGPVVSALSEIPTSSLIPLRNIRRDNESTRCRRRASTASARYRGL